ncbi:MAG TPA: hypothetical protein ENH55_16665 [Aurantimonas coralicida]|uniref:Alpha/beta hydrolase n=2 Tax=root TaxID=1 RepID=A0A9C9NFY5_9HYPH|nr:hypothetical protein [Aurantimonas coralicida]HEU00538.1 hypothetical protein [Aurantimonas coralicida]
MTPGVSFLDGRVHALDRDGRPVIHGWAPEAFAWLALRLGGETGRPVVLVHGFGYDPRARSRDNPHHRGPLGGAGSFARWRRDLMPARLRVGQLDRPEPKGRCPGLGFGWYSVPLGLRGVLGAWRHGRWNRYRYAWDLAEAAGPALSVMLRRLGGPVDVLCHSLGSRVVIEALGADTALPVKNVVFMNGAEFAVPAGLRARANSHIRFVNLVVAADDVLAKLDTAFAPVSGQGAPIGLDGLRGLGSGAPDNWIDIALDDPEVQLWGAIHTWHLQGDNPKKWADHWYTYRHAGNHGLIRAALAGEFLDPPPSVI